MYNSDDTFQLLQAYLFESQAPDELIDAMLLLENEFQLLQEQSEKLNYIDEIIRDIAPVPY